MAENSVYEGTCATRQVAALSNEVCDEFPLWPYGEFLRRQSLHISTNIFVELYIYIDPDPSMDFWGKSQSPRNGLRAQTQNCFP